MTSDPVARYLALRAAKFDRRLRLRPMSTAEMLDSALGAYRALGWTLLRLSLLPTFFCLAATAFVTRYALPSLTTTKSGTGEVAQVGEAAVTIFVALAVAIPLFLAGFSYIAGLAIQLVSDYTLGDAADPDRAQVVARACMGRVFGAMLRGLLLSLLGVLISIFLILVGSYAANAGGAGESAGSVAAVVGVVGLFIGAILFFVFIASQSLAAPAVVLEGLRGKEAMRRSRKLLRNVAYHGSGAASIWSLFWYMALSAFVIWLGAGGLFAILGARDVLERALAGTPYQDVLLTAFDLLPSFFVLWAVLPFWGAAVTIIYYERRIRLEGYDIEALAQDIRPDARVTR